MRTLSPELLAALQQERVAIVQLLRVKLPSIEIALNTSNFDIAYGGLTYLGASGLGSIAEVKDASGEVQGLRLELAGGDAQQIALALDAGDEFQGSLVELRTAVLDDQLVVVDAPLEWRGYGDTFSLQEDGATAAISATAESDQVDLLRGRPLTSSDGDHQSLYPGDLAYEFVQSQVGQPVVWPSKEFFYQ